MENSIHFPVTGCSNASPQEEVPHSVLAPLSRIWHLPTVDNRVRQTAPGSDDGVRSLDGSLPMTVPVLLFLPYPPPGNPVPLFFAPVIPFIHNFRHVSFLVFQQVIHEVTHIIHRFSTNHSPVGFLKLVLLTCLLRAAAAFLFLAYTMIPPTEACPACG